MAAPLGQLGLQGPARKPPGARSAQGPAAGASSHPCAGAPQRPPGDRRVFPPSRIALPLTSLFPHSSLPLPSPLPPPRGSDLEPMAPRGPPQVPPAADPPRRGRRPVHSRFTLTRIPGPGTAASGTALRTFSGLWAVVSSEALRNISELNPAPHRHGGPDARSSHIQLVGTTPS